MNQIVDPLVDRLRGIEIHRLRARPERQSKGNGPARAKLLYSFCFLLKWVGSIVEFGVEAR